MKSKNKISYFSQAFMMLAFMGAVSACVQDDYAIDDVVKANASKEGLAVSPVVAESQVKTASTRTASDDALKEKTLNTLDVFVEHITNGTGDGTFLKQYHLPFEIGEGGEAGAAVQEAVNNWLADRWRQEGLQDGEKYNIYVAANNPLTAGNIANVTTLKGLTYNEVEQGAAIVNETNNSITWGTTSTSGNIYKVYDANPGNSRFLTSDKMFMMDGVIKNWTPVRGSKTQVFDVTMNRAAAKIVLNLKFDADFLKSLTHTKDGENWVEKPAAEQVQVTGSPAWRFNNFAFGAPVFTPDTAPTAGVEVHNSDFNIFHNQDFTGDDKHATITTYSYPSVWSDADATGAPSLVVSVGYKQGDGEPTYNYYRIPIVPKTTTSLDRNTIYVIDATIATRGSDSHEDVTEMENLVYEVLPWNDESNSDAIHNEVKAIQHQYLKVYPKIYTLHGDDNQSLIINYQKATGTQVGWQLYSFNTTTEAKGNPVESTANNAVWGWFYDKNGNMKTTYGTGNSALYHMGVTIQQSAEVTSGSSGTVTVTSKALDNRAIKYMLLRVYLKDNPALYEDVIIRHFPTDNIQSITGAWSSYHTTTEGSTETGNWVDWDRDHNQTGNTARYVVRRDDPSFTDTRFHAHVYDGNRMREINSTTGRWGNLADYGSNTGEHYNNHMYVVQISSTSDKYVLGKPVLGNPDANRSQDEVVAPAFMIASQLGVVSTGWNSASAAEHCRRYMEVGTDETRYGGWRLPTDDEISIICDYQRGRFGTITVPVADRVMDVVLRGQYYFNLSGGTSYVPDHEGGDGEYLRCIRELSAEEIEKLNGFESIVNRYRSSGH